MFIKGRSQVTVAEFQFERLLLLCKLRLVLKKAAILAHLAISALTSFFVLKNVSEPRCSLKHNHIARFSEATHVNSFGGFTTLNACITINKYAK